MAWSCLDERTRQRLQDILDFDVELKGSLADCSAEEFANDRGMQRIAERLLEIAGEAAAHIPDETWETIGGNWEGLQRMRILLAHAYHRVDVGRLWHAASVSLPGLADAIRAHLD